MTKTPAGILKSLQAISWNIADVTFYVVHQRKIQRTAHYEIKSVGIGSEIGKKLGNTAKNRIQEATRVEEYDFNTVDLDNGLLSMPLSGNDFEYILSGIMGNSDIPPVTKFEELLNSWMYIARLEVDDSVLFFARYISAVWKAKKIQGWDSRLVWDGNMLIDIEQNAIFPIDSKIDFFCYNELIFIADKTHFETATNFREGMERNRDEIVEEFKELGLFQDCNQFSSLIGNNLHYLRKLSQVKRAEYYKNTDFLKELKTVNGKEGWGLEYTPDGKIIVTEKNIAMVLKLLNNDRLESPINQEVFDVDVKRKLASNS